MALNDRAPSRYFIQFMHPGGEHRPDKNGFVAWNSGIHKRKFVQQPGEYVVSPDQVVQQSSLHFWTEWEAESRLVRGFVNPAAGYPTSLFEPLLYPKTSYAGLCNTDPCAFGGFHYCICQQRGVMKKLDRGSVILFGSRVAGRFALDTVFVVDTWDDYSAKTYKSLTVPKGYREVGLDPLFHGQSYPKCVSADLHMFRLYRGATYDDPVEGMFSFFPCLAATASQGFPRPEVKLGNAITQNLSQGYRKTGPLTTQQAAGPWRQVVDQVLAAKLCLGVSAEMPQRAPQGVAH